MRLLISFLSFALFGSAFGADKPLLMPQQMREDLQYFRDVCMFQDKSFDAQQRITFENIVKDALSRADTLTPAQFALEVGKATAVSGNGHTLAALPNWHGFSGFPFKAYWFADGLFIVRAHPDFAELLGARIVRLGSLTPEEALLRLTPYISGTPARIRNLSPGYLRLIEVLKQIGATSSDQRVPVRLVLKNGKSRTVTLGREPSRDPENMHPSRQLVIAPADKRPPGHWLHVLDPLESTPLAFRPLVDLASEWLSGQDRILYLRSNQIAPLNSNDSLMAKIEGIFHSEVLDSNSQPKPRHVILDLRFNPGGNFLNTVLLAEALPKVLPAGGKVFVLVGPGTFSAALVTAAMFKGRGGERVVIVGDTMGDAPQFWAEGQEMPLPNSGIWIQNAKQYHDWQNGCDDTTRCYWANVAFGVKGVSLEPEIKVVPAFADYAAGKDAVLETVLARITALQTDNAFLPDTPAAKELQDWLEVFNNGDRAALESYRANRLTGNAQSHFDLERLLRFQQQVDGGFVLRKIDESGPSRIAGFLQERDSDRFLQFVVEIEAQEPHRIFDLRIWPAERPAAFSIKRLALPDLARVTRERLEASAAKDRFSGVVLLAQNRKVVFSGAYGFADRDRKVSNSMDTRFRLGSMNKMFTAVAILQLVEQGKIKLADTVGKHLTDYPNSDVASKITIHQLLTHTAGASDIFGPQFDQHRLELRTLNDYISLYGNRGAEFEPGARFSYSNYGYVLLGAIIERAAGVSYYHYVSKHIFEPAGMTSSGSLPEDQEVKDRSLGYMRSPDRKKWVSNANTLPYRGTSAGGGYSTAQDLLRFAHALESGKLLSRSYVTLLTTAKPDSQSAKYAYGFMDMRGPDGKGWVGHGGGAPGMNGEFRIYPDSGYVVIALTNIDPPAAMRMANFIDVRLP